MPPASAARALGHRYGRQAGKPTVQKRDLFPRRHFVEQLLPVWHSSSVRLLDSWLPSQNHSDHFLVGNHEAGNRNDSESIFATKEPKEVRYQ
jgi:hypothetical protein